EARLGIVGQDVDHRGVHPRLGEATDGDQVHPDREAGGTHCLSNDLEESARSGAEIQHPRTWTEEVESLCQLLQLERAARAETLPLGLLEVMVLWPVRLAHASDHVHSIVRGPLKNAD